jgi:hypothetical protein
VQIESLNLVASLSLLGQGLDYVVLYTDLPID